MNQSGRAIAGHAVRGLFWTASGKGAQAILQILVLVVLARLLTPSDFGVVSAAMVVIGFASIFSKLGLGPAVVQRPELEARHVRTAFATSVLFGLLVGGSLWLAAPWIAGFFRTPGIQPVLRALACVFPIGGVSTVAEALLQRELRFRWLAGLEVATWVAAWGLLGITLAAMGAGVWSLVAATISNSLFSTVVLLRAAPHPKSLVPERRALGELMHFGGGFTLARLFNGLALQGDNLVVGRCLGPEALGLYGRAYQLMAQPAALFGQVLDQVLFPTMARVQEDKRRLAAAYTRGVALIALAVLPASVTLFILAPELIQVVLGPRWKAVTVPFQVFAVGMLFRTSYKMSDSVARATAAVYRRAWRTAIYAFLVVGGAWVGQRWGITGVALAVLGALAVNFLMMAALSLDVAGMSWGRFCKAHVPALLLAAASGGITWAVAALLRHWHLPPPVLLLLTTSAMLGSLLLLIAYLPALFLGSEGRWMLEVIGGMLPPRLRLLRLSKREAAIYETA